MARRMTVTEYLNNLTNATLYYRFKNIAINTFEWKGLPKTIKPFYIEEALFEKGRALFFNDANLGLMCLPCSDGGQRNVYNQPVKFNAYGLNYNQSYTIDDSVEIKNNSLRYPTRDYILYYVTKLTEVERTLDNHVKLLKVPFFVRGTDKELLTNKNIMKQIDDNEIFVYVDKSVDPDSIGVLPTEQEIWLPELTDYRHDLTNETLTFLGVNNANTDKRERLVTDEVNANNDYIEETVQYMLQARQEAVEEINAMFGLSISVDLRNKPEEMEVEEDGEVHSGTAESSDE